MSDATVTHTDDWESLVSDTVVSTTTNTTMTPTKDNAPIRNSSTRNNNSDSPWEDASYTLFESEDQDHAVSPYFGRFRRGARNSNTSSRRISDDGNNSGVSPRRNHTNNNHHHFWIREYNVSNAVQYAERFAQQIRFTILYIATWLDCIVAWTMSVYIVWIVYDHCHSIPPPEQQQRDDHSNYIITSIVLSALVVHNVIYQVRCLALLTTLRPPPPRAPTATTTTDHNDDDDDDDTHFYTTWSCRRMWCWLSRISTTLLIVWYGLGAITLLLTWNMGHHDAIRRFVSDDTSSPYNLHGYWRFNRHMIAQIQNNHVMNYLYLVLLSCGILEMVRYHILQSYYTAMVGCLDDGHESTLLQESLLPLRWDDDDVNDPSRITTTSWRTTTITNQWWNQRRRRQEAIRTDDPSHRSILDPVQFQTIQEEWNFRQEVDGPLWWSRE